MRSRTSRRIPAVLATSLAASLALTGLSLLGPPAQARSTPDEAPALAPAAAPTRTAPATPRRGARPPRNDATRKDLRLTQVYVQTTVDSDRDGKPDVVRVVVARPRPKLVNGRRLATVANPSPYFACCGDAPNHDVDVPLRDARAHPDDADGFLRGFRREALDWARRGYAYARVASLGSSRSTGCPTIGDDQETAGMVAFVDWLGGRTTARTPAGQPATAGGWSTGVTGMIGASYDGTLPNMAAATGVPGLKAIVPISAISSWYGYYRQSGLVVAPGGYQGEDTDVLAKFNYTRPNQTICRPVIAGLERDQDRVTGDYSDFWADRNLVPKAHKVRAGVLIAHGFGDTNVKPDQAARWYAALRKAGVPVKIWWDQGDHGTFVPDRLVTRWFDHFLYGVRNGVAGGKAAAVTDADSRTRWYRTWPRPGSKLRTWTLRSGSLAPGGPGTAVRRTFTDDASFSAAQICRTPNRRHALSYRSARLKRGLDLSGSPRARLRVSFDAPAANLTAALCVVKPNGKGRLLTQGFADPRNVGSIRAQTPLAPGRFYSVPVDLQPVDRALEPGSRVVLVVMSSDHDFTLRPPAGTRVTLDPRQSRVRLPIVR
ncbi:CocE/NonD family hydrolase [Nocardioides sp. GXZ039]|uniref:CocE/NonD family hydrolase n=1 Tax=Nocardioides sp. GXZ039 TaxID=3136018 RepID=UPI0030F39709